MSQSIQDRLASRDPAIRRQAIISLGKSGDQRALPLLARVYQNDPDSALRQLALKAGQHLKQQQAAPATPAPPVDPRYAAYIQAGYEPEPSDSPPFILPLYDEEEAPAHAGVQAVARPSPVGSPSDENRREAATLARRGLEAFDQGRHADALKALGAALELNPRLKTETSVQRAAAGLTGQRPAEAVDLLADPLRREMVAGQVSNRAASKRRQTDEGRWSTVMLDLLILVVVTTLWVVLSVWGMTTFFAEVLAVSDVPPEALASLNARGMLFILPVGLLTGVFTAIGAVISYSVIHVVAGFFRGGGSLTQTLHALIPIQTALLVLFAALLVVFALTGSLEITALLSFGLSFGGLIWQVSALSKAHDIGWFSGCAAFIVAALVIGLFSAAISFILGAVLGNVQDILMPAAGLLLAF